MFSRKNLLKACDVPDPCGADIRIWNTAVNKIGSTEDFLCCVEGGKYYGTNCLLQVGSGVLKISFKYGYHVNVWLEGDI